MIHTVVPLPLLSIDSSARSAVGWSKEVAKVRFGVAPDRTIPNSPDRSALCVQPLVGFAASNSAPTSTTSALSHSQSSNTTMVAREP